MGAVTEPLSPSHVRRVQAERRPKVPHTNKITSGNFPRPDFSIRISFMLIRGQVFAGERGSVGWDRPA
jgi:hypothetical protein